MDKWVPAALDYIPRWLEFQMRQSRQPGCVIAIAEKGKIVLEQAFGYADLSRGTALTPRHRFRVASHSKSFTSAGIMKLREAGKLHLDDPVGRYVEGLHREVAAATIAQLLSHSAGLVRDGWDAGQWQDRRAFLNEDELRADLAAAPIIDANTRFKYSNHGFGLAGQVIEAITGAPYKDWIKRQIVTPAGLAETEPDGPLADDVPFARGHSGELPAGRRFVIPGDNPTHALAPATGFVSTASDLVRFFSQIDPAARRSVLSAASRREMTRRQWQDQHSSFGNWYGFGVASGRFADCDWFGHGGGFQGYITRTSVLPERGLTLSILTNATDGWAHLWWGGIMQILAAFAKHGAPSAKVRDWTGRWWTQWGAIDLLPMGRRVLIAGPAMLNPVMDASEIEVSGPDEGRMALANGFASHGEPVRRKHGENGEIQEVWLGGSCFRSEAAVVGELEARYGKPSRARPARLKAAPEKRRAGA
jgi:CubicO group peptidase (beta-lactamase class C family)